MTSTRPAGIAKRARALPWLAMLAFAALAWAIASAHERPLSDSPAAQSMTTQGMTTQGMTTRALTTREHQPKDKQLIDDFLRWHITEPEPSITQQRSLPSLERSLGLDLLVRADFEPHAAQFLGAWLQTFGDLRFAALRYRLVGHQCSIFVFDAERLPVQQFTELEPSVVEGHVVFSQVRRGYTVAAIERRGAGYLLVSDLDPQAARVLVVSLR